MSVLPFEWKFLSLPAMRIKLKFVILGILLVNCGLAFAQRGNYSPNTSGQSRGGSINASGRKKTDAKKDTIVFKMKVFEFQDGYSRIKESRLDTVFADFHNYNPVYKKSISAQTLGNLGASAQSNDFFQRSFDSNEFLFLRNYQSYLTLPKDIHFYNTTKPFTLLDYGQWFVNKPVGESWLKVFQTQNINPALNFGFSYNSISSQGKYLNQEAKDNSLNLFASYNIDRYDLWFIIGKNKSTNQENGGLLNPSDIKNPDLKPENMPVWFTGAAAESNNSFAVIAHQYKFGKWIKVKEKDEEFQKFIPRFTIMHTLEYSDNTRNFHEIDPNPSNDFTDSRGTVYFYGTQHLPYINSAKGSTTLPGTQDKTGMKRFTNLFYLKGVEAPDRKYTFGKQAYIGNDLINMYYPREALIYTPGLMKPPLGLTQTRSISNTFVGGSIFRSNAKFLNWNASGRYYIQGYRAGDFELTGKIEKPIRTSRDTSFVRLTGSMTNSTPDYFYKHYYSNHFKWDNSFDRTYELKVGAAYEKPFRRLKFGFKYSIVNKYIYWNESSLPGQASSEFSVAQFFIRKDFKFGPLNLENSVMYQKSTTDKYLHIPEISTRNTVFLSGLVSKVLALQIGVDMRYDTGYYGDYYSPALGMFYVQHNEKIGDYPWLDAFINLKLKRTRFYVKYSNIGSKLVARRYYTTPTYAAQVASLAFGLSWSFYN